MKNLSKRNNRTHSNLPVIVAVGGSLAAFPAAALELGDVTVQSRLGQPLRASIAYALAPNEQISKSCVSLRQGSSASGLPGVGGATLSVSNGVIMLSGTSAMREPMVSAHVVVNCPYSPNLSREYMLFIDPATPVYESTATTQQASPAAEPVAVTPAPVTPVVRQPQPRAAVSKDIGPATDYRVQPGDSLSAIAARIQNRPVGLWPAVNAIFEANPQAFMNNDPNQLKAGSVLSIPSFDGSAAIVATEVFDAVDASPAVTTPVSAITETPAAVEATPEVNVDPLAETTADLKPGDIVISDNPFVAPVASNENTIIPDTQLEGPTTESSSPNVPTAIIRTSEAASDGTATPSWILWLAGSGIALIVGLLMFGRRLRDETDAPLAPVVDATPRRRASDLETSDTENLESMGVDYDLTDESPTEENLALDADVIIGSGLEVTEQAAVEDFGFAPTAEVDIELPFEPVASDTGETDILAPMHSDEQAILLKEVMPEDDDYDMSVIVDATKMPQPEDVTERDLQAVVVETEDETLISDGYTIDKEVDYQVLEQDYEDELTATQALNDEITRAAADLAERMDAEVVDSDETAALPLASVTELDITAQMPAQNDDVSSMDDTGINEEITINEAAGDATVEMPQSKKAR